LYVKENGGKFIHPANQLGMDDNAGGFASRDDIFTIVQEKLAGTPVASGDPRVR
jgi:hypothetical protein